MNKIYVQQKMKGKHGEHCDFTELEEVTSDTTQEGMKH